MDFVNASLVRSSADRMAHAIETAMPIIQRLLRELPVGQEDEKVLKALEDTADKYRNMNLST